MIVCFVGPRRVATWEQKRNIIGFTIPEKYNIRVHDVHPMYVCSMIKQWFIYADVER